MVQPQPLLEADAGLYDPQPDDDELITRGEHRRMIHVFVRRFERLEELCFEDRLGSDGKVDRPSLESIIVAIHKHITVMCSWARLVKWVAAVVVALGSAFLTATSLIEVLRGIL